MHQILASGEDAMIRFRVEHISRKMLFQIAMVTSDTIRIFDKKMVHMTDDISKIFRHDVRTS